MAQKNFVVKNGLSVNTLEIIDSNGNITANTITGALQNANLGGTTTIVILNVTGNTALGNVALSGDIIPSANNTYNLGSAERAFSELFLSGGTITLGGVALKESGAGGTLEISDKNDPTANVVISANAGIVINGVTSVRNDGRLGDDVLGTGFTDSTLTQFPTGDYDGDDAFVGQTQLSTDPFGVLTANTYSMMEPKGRQKTQDLGTVT